MSDDSSEDGTSISSAPRHFKSKLEEALTAKQEFEARVSTLDEKVKQYEAEIADLRLRVKCISCICSICLHVTYLLGVCLFILLLLVYFCETDAGQCTAAE